MNKKHSWFYWEANGPDVSITLRVTNIMLSHTVQPGVHEDCPITKMDNTSVPKKETHPKRNS
jgi:hypothetical protein